MKTTMKRKMTILAAALPALLAGTGKEAKAQYQELDHYKCYDVLDDTVIGAKVSLVDRFQDREQTVLRPRFLCNPVDKNGEGIINSTDQLVCFSIQKNQNVGEEVTVTTQFGEHVLNVKKDQMLCVPTQEGQEG